MLLHLNHSLVFCWWIWDNAAPCGLFPDGKQTLTASLLMENRFRWIFRLSVCDYLLSKGAAELCCTWVLLVQAGRAAIARPVMATGCWPVCETPWVLETGLRQAVLSAVELWQLVLSIYFYVIRVGGAAPIEAWPRDLVAGPKYEELWMVDYAFSILQRKVWKKKKWWFWSINTPWKITKPSQMLLLVVFFFSLQNRLLVTKSTSAISGCAMLSNSLWALSKRIKNGDKRWATLLMSVSVSYAIINPLAGDVKSILVTGANIKSVIS